MLAHLFYGLDSSEIETYRDRVDARDAERHPARGAGSFSSPTSSSIVLVGDASVFASQLKALGFPDFERIPLAELDLNSPTLRRTTPARDAPSRE